MSSSEDVEALNWSQWLDFDKSNILTIPESAGVYKMHAGMKILYIGGTNQNLRQSLLDCLSDPCISKARRFSYAIITTTKSAADKVKNQLLDEYRSKHIGKLPVCMEEK